MVSKEKESKFEDALVKLEKIVQELESGDLDLEKAIKKFEEGSKLRDFCVAKLKETNTRVEMVIKDKLGDGTDLPVKDLEETGE